MEESSNLLAKIAEHYPELSVASQEVANYLQQHPMAIISLSVAEIAAQTHTSKATVSRFFRQLGYESHQEAKKALLKQRALGFPTLAKETQYDEIEQEMSFIKRTLGEIPQETLNEVIANLATAERVVLIGYRNSYPLAMNFRQQLKQVRGQVNLYPQSAQTIAEDLIDIGKNDLIVILGFRRRPRIFEKLIERFADKTTILLTDPSGQVFNQSVSHLLVCHLGDEQALDSYAAPMSLVSVLCNRVYEYLGNAGQNRAATISDLYDDLGELS